MTWFGANGFWDTWQMITWLAFSKGVWRAWNRTDLSLWKRTSPPVEKQRWTMRIVPLPDLCPCWKRFSKRLVWKSFKNLTRKRCLRDSTLWKCLHCSKSKRMLSKNTYQVFSCVNSVYFLHIIHKYFQKTLNLRQRLQTISFFCTQEI